MIVTEITRNSRYEQIHKRHDLLAIEWYEATKRIQRLRTAEGMDIAIRLLGNTACLKEGDILYEDDEKVVIVTIRPCSVIKVIAADFLDIAYLCSEIGNKHLPLFVEANEWLSKHGFGPELCERQLLYQLNANVGSRHHEQLKFSTKNISIMIDSK